MGVKNLWKLLEPCGKKALLEHKTLAIDTSIWLYQYRGLPSQAIIFSFCRRLFRILYTQIKPVFVFDGTPPAIKQKTMEARKKALELRLIRRYLRNKTCEECGQGLQTCKHFKEEDVEYFESLNLKAQERLKNHTYNWGELSDEDELEDYFKTRRERYDNEDVKELNEVMQNEQLVGNITNELEKGKIDEIIEESDEIHEPMPNADESKYTNWYNDVSITNFDKKKLENLSKIKQLEILADLRSKRKLPMYCDVSNSNNFSVSQIENVKKRNNITSLIRNLNKNAGTRIQSDCRTEALLKKDEEVNIFANYNTLPKYEHEENIEKVKFKDSTDELESLFDVQAQLNERNDTDEKHIKRNSKLENKSIENEIENKIKLNKELMHSSKQKYYTSLPTFNKKVQTTAEILYEETEPLNMTKTEEESKETEDLSIEGLSDEILDSGDDFSEISQEMIQQIHERSTKEVIKEVSEVQRVQLLIIEVLKVFELPYIQARGESDPQCWWLFKHNMINGVISEDSDMIIYGTTVYKNFFRKNKDILEYSLDTVQEQLHLGQNELIKLSYLLGCDYCEGMKGVGIKRAIEKIEIVSDSEIDFLNKIYKQSESGIVPVHEVVFGSLRKDKLACFLAKQGLNEDKIEELLLYVRKVQELYEED